MKKFTLLLLLTLSCNLFGYWLGFLFQRGPVDIIITKSANLIEQESNVYDYLYKNKDETYEIGLFSYAINNDVPDGQKENIEREFEFSSNSVMVYIRPPKSTTKHLEIDGTVKTEINADICLSTLINYNGSPSEYINYNYVIVNRYSKKDKGYIMEIIMFNAIELMNDKQFSEDIKIFKFE